MSSHFSAVITAIKVSVVLLVIIVGSFTSGRRTSRPSSWPTETGPGAAGTGVDQSVFSLLTGGGGSHYGWYGVPAGARRSFFAFIGFDVVATTAEETKNP